MPLTKTAATDTSVSDWCDATTSVSYTNALVGSTGSERWQTNLAISSGKSVVASSVGSGTSPINPTYYHQFLTTFGYATDDGSTIQDSSSGAIAIGSFSQFGSGVTIASAPGSGYGVAHSVGTGTSSDWVDAGTNTIQYDWTRRGTGAYWYEAWALASPFYNDYSVSSSTTVTEINFYHQYFVWVYAHPTDGSGIPSGALLGTYTQFGASNDFYSWGSSGGYTYTDGGDNYGSWWGGTWVDAAGSVTFTTYTASSGTERWALSAGSDSFSGSSLGPSYGIIDYNYYHQFQITFGYSVTNSGVIDNSLVVGHYWQFGGSNDITSDGSGGVSPSAATWVDVGTGTVNYVTATAGSGTERWALSSSPDSMNVAATGTLSESGYYHQFQITFGYSVVNDLTHIDNGLVVGDYYQFGYSQSITSDGTGAVAPASDWVDVGTAQVSYVTATAVSGTERWALSGGSNNYNVASSTTISESGYYHQFEFTLSYSILGGATGATAPTLNTGTQFGISYNPSLTGTATGYWLDNGASWAVDNPLTGSGLSERWQTSQTVSGTVSTAQTTAYVYYHQYKITFGYSTSDLSDIDNTLVVGHYYQFGSSNDITSDGTGAVSPSAATWVDAGSAMVSYVTATAGSGTERWALHSTGTHYYDVSSSTTISESGYYHQFEITFGYTATDASNIANGLVVGSYYQFGSVQSITSDGSGGVTPSGATWVDDGTDVSYVTATAVSGTERWALSSSPDSTTVSASATISESGYYHQFRFMLSYSISDGSSATAPVLTSTQFGGAYTPSLTGTATAYWLDNTASWAVDNPLSGSGASERWQTTQTVSGTVSAAQTTAYVYYHQFTITFGYSTSDLSNIDNALVVGHYYQFGSSNAITSDGAGGVTPSAATWVDAGTGKVSYVTAVAVSGTERWGLSSSPDAMDVSASGTLSEANYYHQFSVSFAYTTNDATTLVSQSNLVAYSQFGSTLYLSTDGSGVLSLSSDWVDAGSAVTYVSPVSISVSERYMIASG